MKILLLLVGSFMIAACNTDNLFDDETDKFFYKNPSFKIDGKYSVISLESEVVVDLNRDGIYAHDLLKEADQWKNADQYFVQFITEQDYNDPSVYVPKLFLWVPYCGVITETNTNVFLYRDFSFTNLLARCYYSETTNTIKIWNGNLGEGQIVSAKIDDDLIVIDFIQSYYTSNEPVYTESGWERLTITGKYKRNSN